MSEPFVDQLLDASFRGVPFYVDASSDTMGRRFQRFDFPGKDGAEHEDLGAIDGPIKLTAMLIGADVLDQEQKLRTALRAAGAGRLIHPWLGEFDVVLAPGSLPEFNWSQKEHRVCRVTLTFERTVISTERPARGLASPAASGRGYDAGSAWLSDMSLRELTQFAGTLETLAGLLGNLFARRSRSDLAPSLAPSLARLSRASASPSRLPTELPAFGRDLSDRLTPQPTPALGGVSTTSPLTSGQQRGAIDGLVRAAPTTNPGLGLILIGIAVEAAPGATYDSRSDAINTRDDLVSGIDDLSGTIAGRPISNRPGSANTRAQAWTAAQAMRSATREDMTVRAGTLPPVRHWMPSAGMPALVGLNRIYGDDPAQLVARLNDLASRNRAVRHPGALPAARLEILDR